MLLWSCVSAALRAADSALILFLSCASAAWRTEISSGSPPTWALTVCAAHAMVAAKQILSRRLSMTITSPTLVFTGDAKGEGRAARSGRGLSLAAKAGFPRRRHLPPPKFRQPIGTGTLRRLIARVNNDVVITGSRVEVNPMNPGARRSEAAP